MGNDKTALAKRDERGYSDLVRDGANLTGEQWDSARIAAAKEFLPREFRSNPAHMIAFLARANRSGLDPFLGELYAWKDERGDLTFMTARDGFLKALRRDDNIDGPPEVQLVYEDDEFWYEKDGQGNIAVHHKGGFKRGQPLGAYCLIRTKEGPDHLEMRELSDFAHLQNKSNWKNYPLDMIQTRVLSAAARLATNVVAGIYSEADFEMVEDGRRMARLDSAAVADSTEHRQEELRQRLQEAREQDGASYTRAEPIEADATEEPGEDDNSQGRSWEDLEEEAAPESRKPEPGQQKHDPGDDRREGVPDLADDEQDEDEDEQPDEAEGFESTYEKTCPICGEDDFSSPQAYAGHMSGHKKRGETVEGKATADTPDSETETPEALASTSEERSTSDDSTPSSSASSDADSDLASMSKGELLTLAYEESKDKGVDLHELTKEVAGVDEDGNPKSIMDLNERDRIALIEEIRRR